ncbi:MAG: NRDE family protein [Alphaproteobacteria bacterium]|nr:NRDE family protein [Alphaproteobacteria bacterium]
MCTVVILRRPGHRWPVLIAANRDEMLDRPWSPPARHWPDRPDVVAGRDELAGGTWLGINDEGVVAAVMNRPGSLGPADDKRSRGELVLEALDHAEARAAGDALSHIDPQAYRPFNLVVADAGDAIWLRSDPDTGADRVEAFFLPEGLSMLTSHDRNDLHSDRIRTYLPRFEAAAEPDPDSDDWTGWDRLVASRDMGEIGGAPSAMNIVTEFGFGTVSCSLIALPALDAADAGPIWRFAPGRPDEVPFAPVRLK